MPTISDIKIIFSENILILLTVSIAAIMWAFFIYRNTNPVVSKGLRNLLLILRIVTLILIILLIFEPVFGVKLIWRKKPTIGVVIDTSASMSLTDISGERPSQVNSLLQNESLSSLKANAHIAYFTFDLDARHFNPEKDSLKFDGQGTNIAKGLYDATEQIGNANCAGILLVTDGIVNEGERLYRIGQQVKVPVFPIVIGSSEESKDLVLRSVSTNDITYINSEVPIEVRIINKGFSDRKITVHVERNGTILDSKIIQLEENQLEANVQLNIIPEDEGLFKYDVIIPALEDELTYENNMYPFYMRVLKSKLNVLLIAGRPSVEYRFLKKTLEGDQNIQLHAFVQKINSEFYGENIDNLNELLKDTDCMIWLEFPTEGTNSSLLTTFQR